MIDQNTTTMTFLLALLPAKWHHPKTKKTEVSSIFWGFQHGTILQAFCHTFCCTVWLFLLIFFCFWKVACSFDCFLLFPLPAWHHTANILTNRLIVLLFFCFWQNTKIPPHDMMALLLAKAMTQSPTCHCILQSFLFLASSDKRCCQCQCCDHFQSDLWATLLSSTTA